MNLALFHTWGCPLAKKQQKLSLSVQSLGLQEKTKDLFICLSSLPVYHYSMTLGLVLFAIGSATCRPTPNVHVLKYDKNSVKEA